jgi:NADH-quinone oxidoreductase subunit J
VTGEAVAFWALAIVLVGSALAVVLTKNLFHAVLWLALGLTATAGVFLLLQVEFLAAVQLLLYAGGIITIVVFAIVVTERLVGERITQTSRRIVPAASTSALLLWLVVRSISASPLPVERPALRDDQLTRAIGETVLTSYVLPFELLAMLMLAALLGAIYFARPED